MSIPLRSGRLDLQSYGSVTCIPGDHPMCPELRSVIYWTWLHEVANSIRSLTYDIQL